MADIKYADRVKETSASTGSGALTLAGAADAFRAINTVFNNDFDATGLPFDYVITHATNNTWEVGTGHLSTSTNMVRDSVFINSDENTSFINFAAGGLTITITPSKDTIENLVATLISVDTIAEKTAAAGVTVDGVLLKDGAFVSPDAAGPTLLNEAASSTNPTVIPNKADPNTGVGWVSAAIGALIAAGAEVLRWSASGISSNGGTNFQIDGSGNVNVSSAHLELGTPVEHTVSSAAITATSTNMTIDTEADAATDDLATINGAVAGRLYYMRIVSGARITTVQDGVGNIELNGSDFVPGSTRSQLVLLARTSDLVEISRSTN